MSLDYPNRADWLAVRAIKPSPPRYVWTEGTYAPGRNKDKRKVRARNAVERQQAVARFAEGRCKAPKHRFSSRPTYS